jgi:hypothetical protein
MAKTLLDTVNAIFKRANIIKGDAGALTTLTDSARQVWIDKAVQIINEGIDELYSAAGVSAQNEQAESTITLVAGQRAYDLASNLVTLRWPIIDKANTQFLTQYPGGYNAMLVNDPEQDDTGLPIMAAIRPTDSKLFLDRAPTSVEAGRVYTYQYDKDVALTVATDEVPFNDAVWRAMVPAWVELFRVDVNNQLNAALFNVSIGRAARALSRLPMRTSYSPR